MKLFKKRNINIIVTFVLSVVFLTSCDGTTSIYGIEHTSNKKGKYYKHKKYPRYNNDYYYDNYNTIPPGQHKKIHGSKSAKKYAPGQQKKRHKGHH